MASIDIRPVSADGTPTELWARIASTSRHWLAQHGVGLRDACLLVPFAELLVPARQAFAGTAGWLPRIHTTHTLARECPPLETDESSRVAPTGDAAIDRLGAARLLRQQAWADQWARRDRKAFEHGVAVTVRCTHALMAAAAATAPAQRAAFWEQARAQIAVGAGPGAIDRALQRVALEWAAVAGPAATDVLFELHPAAWIVVECGGEEALSRRLQDEAPVPCLRLQIDPSDDDPFNALPGGGRVECLQTIDAEEEAGAAAGEVLAAIARGATPVALIAEDRALVRRIRALLERSGTRIDDETGWSLATTRAGAYAITALRAAHPAAGSDDWLDWLKAYVDTDEVQTVSALEASWRRTRDESAPSDEVKQFWSQARERLQAFAVPRRRPLGHWLAAFDALLFGPEVASSWRDDPAAEQLRAALHMDVAKGEPPPGSAFAHAMDLDPFTDWVSECLEEARFMPQRAGEAALVVLTPLARAIVRPFATVVLPGADERRMAADAASPLPWSDAVMSALALPSQAARQRRQALAFVQLLRVPHLVLIRRRADGDEQLAPSPLLDRLLRRRRDGPDAVVERDAGWPQQEVRRDMVERPLPTAGGRLPEQWSASAVEALRQCPYRFFVRSVLRLQEQEELDDEADKRDYGMWLHATLERFHVERANDGTSVDDAERLRRAAGRELDRMVAAGDVSAAALLPFSAGVDRFVARYVDWLHAHEAEGWRFREAEADRHAPGDAAAGLRLKGRIDRIDVHRRTQAMHLIDYKTSSRQVLMGKVREPLEDTQLAVYGALLADTIEPGVALSAAYLPLDDAEPLRAVEHPDVAATAARMVEALANERRRIEAGVPLPALGAGTVCDHCEARGLCRRDHWPATASLPR